VIEDLDGPVSARDALVHRDILRRASCRMRLSRAVLCRFHLEPEAGMRARHRACLGIVILVALVYTVAVSAQPPGTTVRIGLLEVGGSDPSSEARWKALRERLRELSYMDWADHSAVGSGRADEVIQ
jgi:hypothetical protein